MWTRGFRIVLYVAVTVIASPNPPSWAQVMSAHTRYVDLWGADEWNSCTVRLAPCRTLQHAIDMASSGDVIKLAARHTVASYSGNPPLVTPEPYAGQIVLRRPMTLRIERWDLVPGERKEAVISAMPPLSSPTRQGGGFQIVASGIRIQVTFAGLMILGGLGDNPVDYGGGLWLGALNGGDLSVNVQECLFARNTALYDGGAVFAMSYGNSRLHLNFQYGVLSRNAAMRTGGGVAARVFDTSALSVQTYQLNVNSNAAETGGGLFFEARGGTLTPSLESTHLNGNSAPTGGAIAGIAIGGNLRLSAVNVVAVNNSGQSYPDAGAAISWKAFSGFATLNLINSTITANTSPRAIQIAEFDIGLNTGPGSASASLQNMIVWGNFGSDLHLGPGVQVWGGESDIGSFEVASTARFTGRNILNVDPGFMDPPLQYGFDLAENSVLRNFGACGYWDGTAYVRLAPYVDKGNFPRPGYGQIIGCTPGARQYRWPR